MEEKLEQAALVAAWGSAVISMQLNSLHETLPICEEEPLLAGLPPRAALAVVTRATGLEEGMDFAVLGEEGTCTLVFHGSASFRALLDLQAGSTTILEAFASCVGEWRAAERSAKYLQRRVSRWWRSHAAARILESSARSREIDEMVTAELFIDGAELEDVGAELEGVGEEELHSAQLAFEKFDTNQDGVVSFDDFITAMLLDTGSRGMADPTVLRTMFEAVRCATHVQ